MKKVLGMILVVAMLVMTSVVFAEGNGDAQGEMPQMQGGPQQGNAPGGQPSLNGQVNGNGQQPNMPQMNGQANGQQPNAPQMNGQANGQQPPMPQMNGQDNGQQPPMPQMNGQANGQQPQMPQMNGQMPMNPPQMDGNAPDGMGPEMKVIDFDAMAENAVISTETLEKIKAYMEEHKPEQMPAMNGQQPMNGMPPEKLETDGEGTAEEGTVPDGLLADLLKDGIITEAEYEALTAAQ